MADFPPVGMVEGEDSRYFEVKRRSNSVSATYEDGYEVTRPRSTRRPGRVFKTGFTDIGDADKALLENFWETVNGNADIFTWNDPTSGEIINVRFGDDMDFKYGGAGGYNLWTVTITLREV